MQGIEEINRQNRELAENPELAQTVRSLGGFVPGDVRLVGPSERVARPDPQPHAGSDALRQTDFMYSTFDEVAHILPVTGRARTVMGRVAGKVQHTRWGLLYVFAVQDAEGIRDHLVSHGYVFENH